MVLKLEQSSIYYSSDLKKKEKKKRNKSVYTILIYSKRDRLYVTTWPWREQNFNIGKCINRDN